MSAEENIKYLRGCFIDSSNFQVYTMYSQMMNALHTGVKRLCWVISFVLVLLIKESYFPDRLWYNPVFIFFFVVIWAILFNLYVFIVGSRLINISINDNLIEIKQILRESQNK